MIEQKAASSVRDYVKKMQFARKIWANFSLLQPKGTSWVLCNGKSLCVKKNSFNIKVFQLCYYVQKNRHDWIIYASFRYPNTISSRILYTEFHYYETIFSHSSWYFLRDFKCHASTTFSYTSCKFAVSRIQFTISYFFGASTTRVVIAERYSTPRWRIDSTYYNISCLAKFFSIITPYTQKKYMFLFHTSAFLSILIRICLAILK